MQNVTDGLVVQVSECDLQLSDRVWDFAELNAAAIDLHWQRRCKESPAFFNGRILMLTNYEIADGKFAGELFETDFKSFLYWRETGQSPGAGIIDGFGSALIRSCEGHVLLGQQTPGNVNGGMAYLPGGFIDRRDIEIASGRRVVNIANSIAREVEEETGLGSHDQTALPGYTLTLLPAQVSIAVTYQSPLPSQVLRTQILKHIKTEVEPELADIVIVRADKDLQSLNLVPYARVLLRHIFGTALL